MATEPTTQNGNGDHDQEEQTAPDAHSAEAACARVHATEGASFCMHCGSMKDAEGKWAKPTPTAPSRRERDRDR